MVQATMSNAGNLAQEVERFRPVREKTLAFLGTVTQQQSVWSPGKGVWSIAQIADHLLIWDGIYREQFGRLMQLSREGKGTSIDISLRELDTSLAVIPREIVPLFDVPLRIFNYFVPPVFREVMVRYPFVSATSPKVSDPREGLLIEKLREDLAASAIATEQLFTTNLPANVETLRINHPIMGNNTIPQMLRILIAHEERHRGQMATVKASPNFPS